MDTFDKEIVFYILTVFLIFFIFLSGEDLKIVLNFLFMKIF